MSDEYQRGWEAGHQDAILQLDAYRTQAQELADRIAALEAQLLEAGVAPADELEAPAIGGQVGTIQIDG